MKKNWIGLVILLMAASGWSAEKAADKALAPGSYSAKVTALSCEGCGPFVEETLTNQGFEAVSVDRKTSMARFTVKKDSQITLAQLQKELTAAATQMGMGADYTLKNLKPADATSESKTQ